MLLSSLTPNELEWMAFLMPDRLDIVRAQAAVCLVELDYSEAHIAGLEDENAQLRSKVDQLEDELGYD